jgi:hypothetical protein
LSAEIAKDPGKIDNIDLAVEAAHSVDKAAIINDVSDVESLDSEDWEDMAYRPDPSQGGEVETDPEENYEMDSDEE